MSDAAPQTLALRAEGPVLHVTLNRPARRNAMSAAMVAELSDVLASVAVGETRVLVLRGAGGHFCAGGDISDMAEAAGAQAAGGDPVAAFNRTFGTLLQAAEACPAAVVAVCEGAVMGGGFGLACVADVTIAVDGARFRLPETSLGISPAQIAPFIVRRVGLSHARRLAVTGQTLGAQDAVDLQLAHHFAPSAEAADGLLSQTLSSILRCEPHAVAETKRLMLATSATQLDAVLDDAARGFSVLARSERAQAGFTAFLTRQPAPWVPSES